MPKIEIFHLEEKVKLSHFNRYGKKNVNRKYLRDSFS